MLRRTLIALPALLLVLALPVHAAQYRDFGNYRVYYSAFKSDIIAPEIAKSYGLSRSSYQAIVNITVQKKVGNSYEPVNAKVAGTARNIYSTIQDLKMKEIKEGKVVYYLAELPITDGQTLTFKVRVVPQGEKVAMDLSFKRQFFVK